MKTYLKTDKITLLFSSDLITLFFSMRPFVDYDQEKKYFKYTTSIDYCLKKDRNSKLIVFVRAIRHLSKNEQIITISEFKSKYKKVVLFQDKDSPQIGYTHLLDFIDYYITPHMYKEESKLIEDNNIFRDFFNEELKRDIGKELIIINRHKIILGWNLGVGLYPQLRLRMKIVARLIKFLGFKYHLYSLIKPGKYPSSQKKVTINAVFKDQNTHRKLIKRKVSKDPRYLTRKLSSRKFNEQIGHSKIVISPFGNGEVCFRDFEAIHAESLLIKPDMSHVTTFPNIYIPYVTYIPIRWDLSDFEEKVEYYYNNEKDWQKIVLVAKKTLQEELGKLNHKVLNLLKTIEK